MKKHRQIHYFLILSLIFSLTVIQFAIMAKSHIHITADGELIAHFHPLRDNEEENDEHNSYPEHKHTRQQYVSYSSSQIINSTKINFIFITDIFHEKNTFNIPQMPPIKTTNLLHHITLRGPPTL